MGCLYIRGDIDRQRALAGIQRLDLGWGYRGMRYEFQDIPYEALGYVEVGHGWDGDGDGLDHGPRMRIIWRSSMVDNAGVLLTGDFEL